MVLFFKLGFPRWTDGTTFPVPRNLTRIMHEGRSLGYTTAVLNATESRSERVSMLFGWVANASLHGFLGLTALFAQTRALRRAAKFDSGEV